MIYMYYPSLFRKKKNELIFWTTCGPATTFDPKIIGVAGTWYFDDGTMMSAASGEEISKTFATEGLHRAVYRPASGGLAAIKAIDATSDLITSIQGIERLVANSLTFTTNAGLVISLARLPKTTTSIIFSGCSLLTGNLSDLSPVSISIYLRNCPLLTGSLSSLPTSSRVVWLYGNTLIAAGSVSLLTALQDLRVYDMGWLTADVDTVIDSMWAARANYTYATPSLNIGGTNQPPTGNVTAPVEGSDWHLDGATWIPLTSGAKIWDLAKNVNSEARTAAWTITYTGGSIAP